MSAHVGLTDLEWLGELRKVEVTVIEGDDALIGTELLIATTVTIDYPSTILTHTKKHRRVAASSLTRYPTTIKRRINVR